MTWNPIWVLPNIDLDAPVESDFFALAPFADRRIPEMKRRHPEFRKFMMRFTDTFRKRIDPTLVLCRENAPQRLTTSEAATSFRDLLVASMVPYAQSRNIINDNTHFQATYSSYFWVYPWMTDRDDRKISAVTPTLVAVHEAQQFKGQSSPDLSPTMAIRSNFDEPLLQELLGRWNARYNVDEPSWKNIALCRSLNMANQASLFPGGVDATIHDFGRIAGLWVSSFEILVHPGGSGQANLTKVLELLERVPWIDKKCGHRRYEVRIGKQIARKNLACWLYREMYRCRNEFLHGNPVNIASLQIRQSGRGLIPFGAILYRLGLTSFLDLSLKEEPPSLTDTEAFAQFISDNWDFEKPQKVAEEALCLARVSEEEERRKRARRPWSLPLALAFSPTGRVAPVVQRQPS
ncbi:MAG: hypothetical protein IIB65_06525 [Proteobacteria bacterium]|nr:hypothetical protein [Pseudomonadota bacterium]